MKGKFKIAITVILGVLIFSLFILFLNKNNPTKLSGNLDLVINEENYSYIKEISEKFEKENPKVKINISKEKNENYIEKLNYKILNEDLPDIALSDNKTVKNILKSNIQLINVSDLIDIYNMNFSKRNLQEVYFNESYLGIPFETNPIVMYVREDLLKKFGYEYFDINNWENIIKIGEEVYKKSNKKIKILNGTKSDFDYINYLVFNQYLVKYNDSEKAKKETNKFIEKLKKKNILRLDEKEGFLVRINSYKITDEIKNYDVKCEWTANDAPSLEVGENRFFLKDGYSLIGFNKDKNKNNLIKSFLSFITNETEIALDYTLKGEVFSSYLYSYKNVKVENEINNFIGKSPFVVMSNILEKAPKVKNYEKLND